MDADSSSSLQSVQRLSISRVRYTYEIVVKAETEVDASLDAGPVGEGEQKYRA